MRNAPLEEKIESMLLGVALGDSLGVPTEMQTAEKIRERFGRVTGFLPTRHNAMFVKDGFPADSDEGGYYSDDTVLTFATLRSIANNGGVDEFDIVREQVRSAEAWPYGFGRATREVFDRIRKGGEEFRSGSDSAGNGVLMKQSPLAAYEALSGDSPFVGEQYVANFAFATHRTAEAAVASLVHHRVLVSLLLDGHSDAYAVLSKAKEDAERFEMSNCASGLKDRVTDRIDRLLEMSWSASSKTTPSDADIRSAFDWGDRIGASCYSLTTLGIAYSLFFRNPHSIEAMFDAVNFGGDTDSYAGIVGSMLGAANGKFYSDELFAGVKGWEVLRAEVKAFLKSAGK